MILCNNMQTDFLKGLWRMTNSKNTKDDFSLEPVDGRISFILEPDQKVQVTIDLGDSVAERKAVIVHVEKAGNENTALAEISQIRKLFVGFANKLRLETVAFFRRVGKYDLAAWLFIGAVGVYLITRLIGLDRYPVYFFTDEAIQTQSIVDLIKLDYRDTEGVFLPTYFANGEYRNLSLSVYLQWLPLLLFGKSAIVTRTTSVLITLIAAISVGVILRDFFKIKYWWTATLFLSITPSWFLHSRTAFETAEFTAFYAGTLCAYLFYRYKSPRYLYPTLFLGGLAFYTYNPGQLIVPVTALALLISDWRYHWQHRMTALRGLALLLVIALPYIRFRINDPDAAYAHLHLLSSYLTDLQLPLSQKISLYFSEYLVGIRPWYWYQFNDRDLARHQMSTYGNIMMFTLPLAIIGLAYVLKHIRQPAPRAVLISFLAAPVAAALVQTGITRALIFVIPAAMLTALGLDQILKWLENPLRQITELSAASGLTLKRAIVSVIILLAGIWAAYLSTESIDRNSVLALAIILALEVSGILESLAKRFQQQAPPQQQSPLQMLMPFLVFAILATLNIRLLNDALRNGPLWSDDYGMGGLQYGAFQIYDVIDEYMQENAETHVVLSPNWANGADVLTRFFMGDLPSLSLGSIEGYVVQPYPLDDNTLFVMTPAEYAMASVNDRFTNVRVERVVPYPDGNPGFYFVRLRYVDNIDEIFAAEKAERQALQEAVVVMDGEEVQIRHTYLETSDQSAAIALVFDGDPYTLAKTFENNPFVIEMTFPSIRTINGFSIIIGSAKAQVTLTGYSEPGAVPVTYVFEGQGSLKQPELSFDLPKSIQAQILRVEMFDTVSLSPTQIHIWEIKLR